MKYEIDCYYSPKNLPKKYDVVSVVAFIPPNAYKPTIMYLDGLRKLVKIVRKKLPTFILQIYHDDSIIIPKHKNADINREVEKQWKPFIESLKRLDKIQLIKYRFEDFLDQENNICHMGTFGTIVRFFPMFDFKDNNTNLVVISDLDVIQPILFSNNVPMMKKKGIYLYILNLGYVIFYKNGLY